VEPQARISMMPVPKPVWMQSGQSQKCLSPSDLSRVDGGPFRRINSDFGL